MAINWMAIFDYTALKKVFGGAAIEKTYFSFSCNSFGFICLCFGCKRIN